MKANLKEYKNQLNQLLKSFDKLQSTRGLDKWSKETTAHYTAMHIGLLFEKIAHSSLITYEPFEAEESDPSELPESNWPYLVRWLESILDCLNTEDLELFQINLAKSSEFFNRYVEVIVDETQDLIEA